MIGIALYDSLTRIDEELIDRAVASPTAPPAKARPIPFRRWAVIAECTCFLLLVGVILFAHVFPSIYSGTTKRPSVDASDILEVKNGSLTYSTDWIKHSNEISYSEKRYVDEKLVGDTQKVRLLGQEYEIEYEESSQLGTRDYSLRYYSIKGKGAEEGQEKQQIVLSKDGIVVGAFRPSGLQISYTEEDFADSERMREIIEVSFKEEIDFADYDQCTVTPSTSVYASWNDDPNRFYSFFWYRSAGESRLSDSTKVVASFRDGVTVLWMLNRLNEDFSAFDQKVAYKDHSAKIEEKLNQIYNQKGRLIDYRIWDSVVCVFNGKFYLDYTIIVNYKLTDNQTGNDSCELLIPLQK